MVDLHVDLPWQLHYKGRSLALDRGMVTAKGMVSGKVMGIVLPMYIPGKVRPGGPLVSDLEEVFATIDRLVRQPDSPFRMLPQAEQGRQVRGWLALEGAQALASDPEAIEGWVKRGVRLVGLVHGSDNELAGSSTGKKRGGLTDKGKRLARKAIEAGALLDVSHLSDAAFEDVAMISRELGVPFVATHSNARALCKHPRNLTDAQLRAIAASGGVVGLNFHGPYVSDKPDPGLGEVVAQAEHLLRVVGEDALAIGSDFDGGILPVVGLPDASAFPKLAAALRRRGHSEARVRKIFAENALRVLEFKKSGP
ncbi:MAG: membrane dipeptidase [Myxococcales bacterium]|nr:membrane dipeptidase [Polyangiaceae bacterium]MDW8248739.1 membrane dipeptidase [Myxococcales bacterium]